MLGMGHRVGPDQHGHLQAAQAGPVAVIIGTGRQQHAVVTGVQQQGAAVGAAGLLQQPNPLRQQMAAVVGVVVVGIGHGAVAGRCALLQLGVAAIGVQHDQLARGRIGQGRAQAAR